MQSVSNLVPCGLGVFILLLAISSLEENVSRLLTLHQSSFGGFELVVDKT